MLLFTCFKRALGPKLPRYSKLVLPAAPQSAHRLLCGCFTSSSKIFLFRSWFAISTENRRPLSLDGPRRQHWAWCCDRLNPGRDKTGPTEKGNLPSRLQKQVPAQLYAQAAETSFLKSPKSKNLTALTAEVITKAFILYFKLLYIDSHLCHYARSDLTLQALTPSPPSFNWKLHL